MPRIAYFVKNIVDKHVLSEDEKKTQEYVSKLLHYSYEASH